MTSTSSSSSSSSSTIEETIKCHACFKILPSTFAICFGCKPNKQKSRATRSHYQGVNNIMFKYKTRGKICGQIHTTIHRGRLTRSGGRSNLTVRINQLYVWPAFRRSGVGSSLMKHVMNRFGSGIAIQITPSPFGPGKRLTQIRLQRFYAKYGFRFKNDNDDDDDDDDSNDEVTMKHMVR
jgi:ribosomal protein S18 acetylase RimI-like enzyme